MLDGSDKSSQRHSIAAAKTMANYLRSEEEIAEYLRQVLETNDLAELTGALDVIAHMRYDTTGLRQPFTTKAFQKPGTDGGHYGPNTTLTHNQQIIVQN